MKKFMLAISAIFLALTVSFVSPSLASAETQQTVFNSVYNYLVLNPLEEIQEAQIEEYALKVESAITLAEELANNEEVKSTIIDFDSKHYSILKKYKLFVSNYKLGSIYNEQDYSNTENGIILLNKEKSIAETAILNAVNKSQVDDAFLTFYNFINSNALAKNVSIAKTNEESTVYGEVSTVDGSLYFSTDDYLIISKYNNSAIFKNAQVALLESEELLMEKGGIAYYFNVQLNKNGVILENLETPLLVKIKLDGANLTVEDGTVCQIAVYKGNRTVELKNANVLNGALEFEISELGAYALCLEGYAIQNRSAVVTFFSKYWVYVLLGAVVIFIIVTPITVARKVKRRKLKKEKQEYKRYKKAKKLEIKKQKKQKRNEKV